MLYWKNSSSERFRHWIRIEHLLVQIGPFPRRVMALNLSSGSYIKSLDSILTIPVKLWRLATGRIYMMRCINAPNSRAHDLDCLDDHPYRLAPDLLQDSITPTYLTHDCGDGYSQLRIYGHADCDQCPRLAEIIYRLVERRSLGSIIINTRSAKM